MLGICYGHQLIAYCNKGRVIQGKSGEYGLTELKTIRESQLLNCLDKTEKVWMNQKDIVKELPKDYSIIASTENSPIAVFENIKDKMYGVQFHPEVSHTINGNKILENFVLRICKAKKEWGVSAIIENINKEIKRKLRSKKAIIALSGGVDSSTAAILINKIIGKNLTAVYVDTGLMRYKETEFIRTVFSKYDLNLKIVNAQDRFFNSLKGALNIRSKRSNSSTSKFKPF